MSEELKRNLEQLAEKDSDSGFAYHANGPRRRGQAEMHLYGKRALAAHWLMEHGVDALSRPTPHPIANAGEAMREAVARVIYPEAFTPETPHSNQVYRQMGYHEARADAFSKANAILSLLPSAPEGDAAAMRESAARSIDRYLEGSCDAVDFALKQRICCSGHECGCMGSDVASYLKHYLAAAIRALPLPANAQAEGVDQ